MAGGWAGYSLVLCLFIGIITVNNDEMVFYTKFLCGLAAKKKTIVDAARMMGKTPANLTSVVKTLCQVPEINSRIGHWPRRSGGYVFLADHAKIESLCEAEHGQHVWADKLRGDFYVVYDNPPTDEDGNRLVRRQLGTAIGRSLRSLGV